MEVVRRKQGLVLEWLDIKFFVRPYVTAEDRFVVTFCKSGRVRDGVVYYDTVDFMRTLIERFVTGWEGVTQDGQPVPFSMDVLAQLPPYVEGAQPPLTGEVYYDLGTFIKENVWRKYQEESAEIKKKSVKQSGGS